MCYVYCSCSRLWRHILPVFRCRRPGAPAPAAARRGETRERATKTGSIQDVTPQTRNTNSIHDTLVSFLRPCRIGRGAVAVRAHSTGAPRARRVRRSAGR